MENNDKMAHIADVLGMDKDTLNAVTRQVKFEKKERGLYERTENSTILITEDNKVMLND